jgi:hypothetical protein
MGVSFIFSFFDTTLFYLAIKMATPTCFCKTYHRRHCTLNAKEKYR